MRKTALITGAAGGIGSAAARALAREGYNLLLNYRNSRQAALNLQADLRREGCDAITFRADVADADRVAEMFAKVQEHFGGLDLLINNAGISQQKLFTDITQTDYNCMFDSHVRGCFNCCQAALPSMINKKSGKIINISSVWGIEGASCEVHYSAAKAAIIGMTKALAKEVGPSKIQVNCIAPGVIDTGMNKDFSTQEIDDLVDSTPLGRMGSPDDIAELILFLASSKADFITGQVIGVDGGFR
ncbi:MAG: 3-oxoacyl-ACP reductase FabG [Clostridiales bacterium]|nr:3-oxoacyl-ACP reductase FabG [Clostridiales bacterium]